MNEEEFNMHLRAGQYYGQTATCGNKIDYKSEPTANKAAVGLANKNSRDLEGYPCFWCKGWHIGRALTEPERIAFSNPDVVHQMGDMETIHIDVTDSEWGMQLGVKPLKVHGKAVCYGEYCCVHNPSDHPLKDAPMNWRADLRIMERFCKHGIGHPDPDDASYRKQRDGKRFTGTTHGCDGCC